MFLFLSPLLRLKFPLHPVAHPFAVVQLSIKWQRFCTFFLAAFPTLVFTTLPPSSSLPHAGFLFPLIFSSTSSLALSALLGSTYNISLFLQLSLLHAAFTSCLLFILVLVSYLFPLVRSCVNSYLHLSYKWHFFFTSFRLSLCLVESLVIS